MNLILKYIIGGSTAALVDLSILNYMDSVGFHHRVSVNVAFISAFMVSFLFQKYWTFSDSLSDKVHKQLINYFIVSVINVILNSIIVEIILNFELFVGFPILRELVWAQILSSMIIATESFIIYRYFIFKKINHAKKNILIITQKVDINDSYFGFFHDWIKNFSQNFNKVTVISLETYKYDLPDNVKVMSLGKELSNSRLKYIILLLKFSFSERKNYDHVFCHMSPLYVISGYLVWKILGKKISLWYVHRNVDFKLKIATLLSDIIFTATPESFGIKSKKVNYMGQSVNVERFSRPVNFVKEKDKNLLKIITVGRITPIKRLEILIDTGIDLKKNNIPFEIKIVGAPITEKDIDYEKRIRLQIDEGGIKDNIVFTGPIANKNIQSLYWNSDIFVNLSPNGGLDKASLEAMASSLPTFVSNKAFKPYLGKYADYLLFNASSDLYLKIIEILNNEKSQIIGLELKSMVNEKSNLDNLIKEINRKININ